MSIVPKTKSKLSILCSIFGLCAPPNAFLENDSIMLEESRCLPSSCKICLEKLLRPLSKRLTVCSHAFHLSCLVSYVKLCVDEMNFPIICPMENCGTEIMEVDVRSILDSNYIEKYKVFSVKHYVETHPKEVVWCPSPDCKYYYFLRTDSENFFCPTCKKNFCVKCRYETHGTLLCEESKDKVFLNFVQNAFYKKCPVCGYWVSKTEGCNHMVCRCKTKFCYGCGKIQSSCSCGK